MADIFFFFYFFPPQNELLHGEKYLLDTLYSDYDGAGDHGDDGHGDDDGDDHQDDDDHSSHHSRQSSLVKVGHPRQPW